MNILRLLALMAVLMVVAPSCDDQADEIKIQQSDVVNELATEGDNSNETTPPPPPPPPGN